MIARSTCLEGVACIRVGKIHWALALPLLVSRKGCSCFVDSNWLLAKERNYPVWCCVETPADDEPYKRTPHPHLPTNIAPSCWCGASVRVLVPSLRCC